MAIVKNRLNISLLSDDIQKVILDALKEKYSSSQVSNDKVNYFVFGINKTAILIVDLKTK